MLKGSQLVKRLVWGCILIVVFHVFYYNRKYEMFALNLFYGDDDHDLKVMTWNIHCGTETSKEHQLAIANFILSENPDVLLLNEFVQDSCLVLDSLLRCHFPFVEDKYSKIKSGDVLFCKSELCHFQRNEDKKFQALTKTIALGRDSVAIFGVHLASNNDSVTYEDFDKTEIGSWKYRLRLYKKKQGNRSKATHTLKSWAMNTLHPIIIMGDMNDFSHSAPMDSLCDAGLQDAWWSGGFGFGNTFHEGLMRLRIDHVFFRGLEMSEVKVIDSDLSDHNPIVACFKQK